MTTNDQPMDHAPDDGIAGEQSGASDLEKNIKSQTTWLRLFFMFVLGFLYAISRVVTAAVILVQFFHVLLQGEKNESLLTFGRSLAIYSFEVVDYLTFNRETKPFPFDAEWPSKLPTD